MNELTRPEGSYLKMMDDGRLSRQLSTDHSFQLLRRQSYRKTLPLHLAITDI